MSPLAPRFSVTLPRLAPDRPCRDCANPAEVAVTFSDGAPAAMLCRPHAERAGFLRLAADTSSLARLRAELEACAPGAGESA